ncbi:von Willebrand factor A domain-containing protein 7-like [Clytia hemisphaerica]|uniref:Hemicentin-1-like von Willebrand factor A domain-containing protein n=1 Tax=Clytia hemisphaerica TaxID=252671 RepID=A0A7M5X1I9_9CNID
MKLLHLSLVLVFSCVLQVKSQGVSDYAALDTFIRDALSGLAKSESKFKEISPVVQGAIDFVSSIDPRRKTDQQRGIQIIQRLNDVSVDRGNKQVLKNLLGRVFGSVWKSSTEAERAAFVKQIKNFIANPPPSAALPAKRKRRMTYEWFDEVSKRLYLLDGLATLMFAIDSTSSMSRDITIAKNIANQILNLEDERKNPVDYILSDINDPVEDLKPTITRPTTQLAQFAEDIGAIIPAGGGDCPEMALTGMLNGFSFAPQYGSSMFVFTDAAPKDATVDNMANVIGAAFGFDTKISFFTVTNPLCDSNPDYSKFQQIADETGGFVFPLVDSTLPTPPTGRKRRSIATDSSNRLPFVTSELKAHTTIYQGNGISTIGKRIFFNIDDEIKFLAIKIQTDANHEQIRLFNEKFQQIKTRNTLGNVVLYKFDNPFSGTYFTLIPRSAGSYRYTVTAAFKNPIVVNTKYFMNDGPVARPIPHPVQGIQNKILISITGYDRVTKHTIAANIILKDGTKTPITLSPDNGSGAFEGSLIPPTSEYKIQIQGKTIGGKSFTRLTSNFEQAKPIAFVTMYAGEDSSVGYKTRTPSFLIAYKSPGSPFAGRVETSLSTSKINDGEIANLNLSSARNFIRLFYTSPTAPIASRTSDEIIIRDNISKKILHRIPILLY